MINDDGSVNWATNESNIWALRKGHPHFEFKSNFRSAEEAQAAIAYARANPIPYQLRTETSGFIPQNAFPAQYGYHIDDVRVEDQTAKPQFPGVQRVTASTHGKTIPVSLGKRRLEGNVIQSSDIAPVLTGNRTYYVEYTIPIYEDPPPPLHDTYVVVNADRDRNDDGTNCGGGDGCSDGANNTVQLGECTWGEVDNDNNPIRSFAAKDMGDCAGLRTWKITDVFNVDGMNVGQIICAADCDSLGAMFGFP